MQTIKMDDNWMGGIKHYEGASKEDVLGLLKQYGNPDNMNECQNDSPSVREFLELADRYPTMKFHGYVVDKARPDFRVSIEGFEVGFLNADQALALMEDYKYADECTHIKKNNMYGVYTWWD